MSIYLENLQVRLVEELRRVGPQVIAKATGIARATVYNWMEKGNVPMDKLALLEVAGADVNYILTGQRMGGAPMAPVAEPTQQLSRRALAVAQNYEATSEEGKKIIEAAAFAAAKPAAKRGAKAA